MRGNLGYATWDVANRGSSLPLQARLYFFISDDCNFVLCNNIGEPWEILNNAVKNSLENKFCWKKSNSQLISKFWPNELRTFVITLSGTIWILPFAIRFVIDHKNVGQKLKKSYQGFIYNGRINYLMIEEFRNCSKFKYAIWNGPFDVATSHSYRIIQNHPCF